MNPTMRWLQTLIAVAILCVLVTGGAVMAQNPLGPGGGVQPLRPPTNSPPLVTIVTPGGSTVNTRTPLILVHYEPGGSYSGDEVNPGSVAVTWGGVTVTSRGRHNASVFEWEVDTLTLSPGQPKTLSVTVCNEMFQCTVQNRSVQLASSPTTILSMTAMPLEALGRVAGAALGGGFAVQGAEVVTGLSVPGYVSWDQPRSTGLTYSSRQSYPRALVNADLEFPGGLPSSLTVKLWDGGVVMSQFTQSSPACSSGGQQRCRVTLEADYVNPGTGAQITHKWLRLEVLATISGVQYSSVDSAEAVIVDRRATPYGSGWWPSGVLRLVTTGNDAVIVGADGTATVYRGYQNQYISPPGDWSTLVWTGSGWELHARTGEVLAFDAQGRLTETRGLNTLWRTQISWTGTDQVYRVTDPAGKYFQFGYTSNVLSAISDVSGRSSPVTITSGRLTRFTPANVTRYWRDFAWTTYADGAVLPLYAADSLGNRDSLVYAGGWPQRVILPNVQDENRANVRPDAWYYAAELRGLNTVTSLDSVHARAVDALGNWTRVTLNRWGQPLRTWDAIGVLGVNTYGGTGLLLTAEWKSGDSTRVFYTYDTFDRRIRSYRVRGGVPFRLDSLVWNPSHRLTRQYGAAGDPYVDVVYNGWASVTSAVSSVGDTTLNTYNATTGRLETVHISGVAGVRHVYYEATWGNTDSVLTPQGTTAARNFYDTLGRLQESRSRITVRATSGTTQLQWRRRIVTYTAIGQVDSVRMERTANCTAPCNTPSWPSPTDTALTRTTRTTYDLAGRPASLISAGQTREQRVYDALGRLTARSRPTSTGAMAWDSLRYDRAGNLRFTVTRRGHTLETRYDSRNRPRARVVPGVGTDTLTYAGPNDELTAITVLNYQDPVGGSNPDLRWVYDPVGRLRSDTAQGHRWTRYTYDAQERPDSIVDPLGSWQVRYHATRGTPDTLVTPFGDRVVYTTDIRGHRNGPTVVTGQGWNFTRSQLWTAQSGAMQLFNTVYGASPFTAGQAVIGEIDPPLASDTLAPRWDEWQGANGPFHTGTDSLQYDGWERVTQALLLRDGAVQRAEGYRFDQAGNLTMDSILGQTETWTFASAGQQLLNARGCTFTYDAAGNQTLASCQDRTAWYTYDALDRLTGVTILGVGTMAYAYDALGQRIARRFNGVTTRFVWRGGHVLFEADSAGAITRSYTWGIGDDDLIAITNHQDANRRYYVVQDLLRSVRGLVERTAGSGTWRVAWRYTPYGESFTTDGSVNFPVRFRWAGAMLDEETGLYFLRTRSYDPRFGRFIQEDVAGFAGGGNLYAYAGGDPTSGRDPSGMVSMPEPQYHGDRMGWSMSGGGSDGCWSDDCSGAWHRGEVWGGFGWAILTLAERQGLYQEYHNAYDAWQRRIPAIGHDLRGQIAVIPIEIRALEYGEFSAAMSAVAEFAVHGDDATMFQDNVRAVFRAGAFAVDAASAFVPFKDPRTGGTVYAWTFKTGMNSPTAVAVLSEAAFQQHPQLLANIVVHESLHVNWPFPGTATHRQIYCAANHVTDYSAGGC